MDPEGGVPPDVLLEHTIDNVFKADRSGGLSESEDAEAKYTEIAYKLGQGWVDQIQGDDTLDAKTKIKQLALISSDLKLGLVDAGTSRGPKARIDEMMGYMGTKDTSKLTPAQRDILYRVTVGFLAGSVARESSIGSVLALEQIARISGKTTEEVASENVWLLNDLRGELAKKGNTFKIDQDVRAKSGLVFRADIQSYGPLSSRR